MSEGTPDRLKEFRAQYKAAAPKPSKLGIVQLVIVVAGFAAVIALLLLRPGAASQANAPAQGGLSADKTREYAVRLEEKKEPMAAIAAYEDYLKKSGLAPKDRAKVCYAMGKLAVEAEKYDAALPYLYQAEFLDPGSELKEEINKKVVLCLDKLQRTVDLRHELRKRTDVKRTQADVKDGETVLAEFAGEVITDRDLDLEIEKLPPAAKDSFNTPEKKADLLKNMVAERLLRDKARRLELDKSPEIQEQLSKQLDSMIVHKLIGDQVRADVKVTPEDVERFYKAETDRFKEPATAEVSMAKADTEEAAKAIKDFPDKPVTVRKGGRVPGASGEATVPDAVFAADAGGVTPPVEIDKQWYVFKVNSKKDERTPSFEEVKDQATRMFQMQKEQEKVMSIIEQTLQERDVHLYPERLKDAKASK